MFKKLGQMQLERFKRIAVAEKIGDGDEEVLQQRTGFTWMCAQKIEVGGKAFQFVNLETASDPANDRGSLVITKIPACAQAQKGEDFPQGCFGLIVRRRRRFGRLWTFLGRDV